MVEYEVFQRQCCDLIRLQAWYAWHLHVQRQLPREGIFGNQLLRFLYEPRPAEVEDAWRACQDAILEACRRHGNRPDTGDLEEGILRQVRAFVDERFIADVLYARYQANYRKGAPFGGFTADVSGDRLTLHFTNTVDPDSPFRHLPELRRGLGRLLDEAKAGCPELAVVTCGTWLNSLPPFCSLFPAAWLASAESAPPAGHGGWWGQFTDRTGALHRDNARHLRQTGSFRYPFRRCACGVGELRDYLGAGDRGDDPGEHR